MRGVGGAVVVVVDVVVDVVELDEAAAGAVVEAAGGRASRESPAEAVDGWACGEIATGGFDIWASAMAAVATRT